MRLVRTIIFTFSPELVLLPLLHFETLYIHPLLGNVIFLLLKKHLVERMNSRTKYKQQGTVERRGKKSRIWNIVATTFPSSKLLYVT